MKDSHSLIDEKIGLQLNVAGTDGAAEDSFRVGGGGRGRPTWAGRQLDLHAAGWSAVAQEDCSLEGNLLNGGDLDVASFPWLEIERLADLRDPIGLGRIGESDADGAGENGRNLESTFAIDLRRRLAFVEVDGRTAGQAADQQLVFRYAEGALNFDGPAGESGRVIGHDPSRDGAHWRQLELPLSTGASEVGLPGLNSEGFGDDTDVRRR